MLTQLRIVSDRCKNGAIGFVSLLLIGVVVSACGFPAWRDQVLRDVAEGRSRVDPSNVGIRSEPVRTIELFNPDGTRAGYGKLQSGRIELFNADSNRAGFGRR